MSPKLITMGKRFGTMAIKPTLAERNNRLMAAMISTRVSIRLFTNPSVSS